MQQQHQQEHHTPQGVQAKTGLLPWLKHAIMGRRDPVAQQLHELEQEGAGIVRIAHFFGALLLVAFSMGSAVGICASLIDGITKAGVFSWAAVPFDVAFVVSLILVAGSDVAMLYAGHTIRMLIQRGAHWLAYVSHIAMIVFATILEGGTFIYMSWRYDDPAVMVIAILIIVRGVWSPIVALYLNMARRKQVTLADIQYHTFRAAAEGVVTDMVHIANDREQPFDHKTELMVAAYPMREHEQKRVQALVDVVRKHATSQQPAAGIAMRAAATLPLAPDPEMHQEIPDTHKALHDGDEYTSYGITDEVYDEDIDDDIGGYRTGIIDRDDLSGGVPSEPLTSEPKTRSRSQTNSAPRRNNHSPAKALRQAHKAMKQEAKAALKRLKRDTLYAICDEYQAAGKLDELNPNKLADLVYKRAHLTVKPSSNTVQRLMGMWSSSRAHKAQLDLQDDLLLPEPLEPEEMRELQEAWN